MLPSETAEKRELRTARKMALPEGIESPRQTLPGPTTPQQLFAQCVANEQKISITRIRVLLPENLKDLLLRRPLFVRSVVGEIESLKMQIQERFPFDFSIIKPKLLAMTEYEWRRSQVGEYLKKLPDAELRLLLIARWLGEEGLCNAEDLLPKDILNSLVERFRKVRRISPTTILHVNLVKTWLPYFDRLYADLQSRKYLERCREVLATLGHDTKAIGWAFRKRSVTEAIFVWLGERKHIDPRNLRNSYSRMRPHPDEDL